MNNTLCIGIDPSFKNLAVSACYLDKAGKLVLLVDSLEDKLPAKKDFINLFHLSLRKAESAYRIITGWIAESGAPSENILVFQEIPPPIGDFAAGLWMLGALLTERVKMISRLSFIYPHMIGSLLGAMKHTKAESKIAAKAIMTMNKIAIPPKLDDDRAEAFILMVYLSNNYGEIKFRLPEYLPAKKWERERNLEYYA